MNYFYIFNVRNEGHVNLKINQTSKIRFEKEIPVNTLFYIIFTDY